MTKRVIQGNLVAVFLLLAIGLGPQHLLAGKLKDARDVNTSPEKLVKIATSGGNISAYWALMNPSLPQQTFDQVIQENDIWLVRASLMTTRTPRERVTQLLREDHRGRDYEMWDVPIQYSAIHCYNELKKLTESDDDLEIRFNCFRAVGGGLTLTIQPYVRGSSSDKWEVAGHWISFLSDVKVNGSMLSIPGALDPMKIRWSVVKQVESYRAGTLAQAVSKKQSKKRPELSPIHQAVVDNDLESLSKLAAKKTHLELRDSNGATAFVAAARIGRKDCLEILLGAGSDGNSTSAYGESALIWAIKGEHWPIANLLLEKRVDLSIRDYLGRTALHYAAAVANLEFIEALRAAGANAESHDLEGLKPLHIAILNNNIEALAPLVLAKSGLANGSNQIDPFVFSSLQAEEATSLKLLEMGSPYTAVDSEGFNALYYGAQRGQAELTKALLDKGVSPNWTSPEGQSVFHIAALNSNVEICSMLFERGAKIPDRAIVDEDIFALGIANLAAGNIEKARNPEAAKQYYASATSYLEESRDYFSQTMEAYEKKLKGKRFKRRMLMVGLTVLSSTLSQMQAQQQFAQWDQIRALNNASNSPQYFSLVNQYKSESRLYLQPDYERMYLRTPDNTSRIDELEIGIEIYKARTEKAVTFLGQAKRAQTNI